MYIWEWCFFFFISIVVCTRFYFSLNFSSIQLFILSVNGQKLSAFFFNIRNKYYCYFSKAIDISVCSFRIKIFYYLTHTQCLDGLNYYFGFNVNFKNICRVGSLERRKMTKSGSNMQFTSGKGSNMQFTCDIISVNINQSTLIDIQN